MKDVSCHQAQTQNVNTAPLAGLRCPHVQYVQKVQKHHFYTKTSIHGCAVKWHMDYSTAAERGGGYNYLVPVG